MRTLAAVACAVALTGCARSSPPPTATLRPIDAPHAYVGLDRQHFGSMTFGFDVPPSARRMDVEFAESLRGARVDADAFASGRTFPLLRDRRIGGSTVTVDWTEADLDRVEVTVHEHLRERPVVRHWQLWASPLPEAP